LVLLLLWLCCVTVAVVVENTDAVVVDVAVMRGD